MIPASRLTSDFTSRLRILLQPICRPAALMDYALRHYPSAFTE